MIRHHGCVFRIGDHVVPFVCVFGAVVKLFRSVIVVDVTILFRDDGIVTGSKTGARIVRPVGPRILQQGNEGIPFEFRIGLQSRQFQQRWINIEQLGGFRTHGSFDDSRSGNDHRRAGSVFPQTAFGKAFLLALVKPVVGVENNVGIVLVGTGIQRIEHFPDLVVGKTDAGQIGLNQRFPLIVFLDPFHGRGDMFEPGEIDAVFRNIFQIVRGDFRQLQRLHRIEIKPLLWRILWDVWRIETRRQEERLIVTFAQLLHAPSRNLVIRHQGILFWKDAPIP